MAWNVRDWRAAGFTGDLHPNESGRVAGVAGRESCKGSGKEVGKGCPEIHRSIRVDDRTDVRIQFIQPWNSGSLPDIPDKGASLCAEDCDVHRRDSESGCAAGRSCIRKLVGESRPAASDISRRDTFNSGDTAVGVLACGAVAGTGWI